MRPDVENLAYARRSFGLLQASAVEAAACFCEWLNEILAPVARMESRPVQGDVCTVLRTLLPIVAPLTRSLFVPCEEQWIILFENSRLGTDTGHIRVLGERLQTTAMRVVAIPHTYPHGDYGAVIWEIYDRDGSVRRSIYAMNDGGSWDFYSAGNAFGFEDVKRYSKKRVRDRFTIDMLETYLASMNLFPFDDSWLAPEQSLLVERIGGYIDVHHAVGDTVH